MRIVIASLLIVGCRSSRAPAPSDATATPQHASTDAASRAPIITAKTPVPWQWIQTPDLYPLLDLTVDHSGSRYVVSLSPGRDDDTQRAVMLRGPTWSVEVARSGTFSGAALVVDNTRAYVATYNRSSAGCKLAAYSTGTGAPVWAVALDGIGPIAHSKYSNRVQLRLINSNPVVFGSEAKRYIEERDAATGALITHQLLGPERAPTVIGEPLYRELHHLLASRKAINIKVNDFLARHVEMQDADHAARGSAFSEAVRQLDGISIAHGAYKLDVQLVDTGSDFEVRVKRLAGGHP